MIKLLLRVVQVLIVFAWYEFTKNIEEKSCIKLDTYYKEIYISIYILMFQLYYFPRRFRYVSGVLIVLSWIATYWYMNLEDFSTTWSYTLQWTYTVDYDSEVLSWQILWSFSGWRDLLWSTLVTLHGSWHYGEDIVSFGPHKVLAHEGSSYVYYGPVEYIASQQTWLSQTIHQYFRLWDSYEKKWYNYENTISRNLSLEILSQALEWYWFTTTHSVKPNKFSRVWRIFFNKSLIKSWNLQALHWEISYVLEPTTTLSIKKPQQYLESSIFTEAFFGSWDLFLN